MLFTLVTVPEASTPSRAAQDMAGHLKYASNPRVLLWSGDCASDARLAMALSLSLAGVTREGHSLASLGGADISELAAEIEREHQAVNGDTPPDSPVYTLLTVIGPRDCWPSWPPTTVPPCRAENYRASA